MKPRNIALYFFSIDARRAFHLLIAWATAPFASRDARRRSLVEAVRVHVDCQQAFAYGSARGALAACLRASEVGPGDKVLLSSYTCLAVPTAVLAIGAQPIYVDIDPHSMCTPANAVVEALEADVRAVVIQHTLGSIAEVGPVVAEAKKRGITVIEDCALALGSRRLGSPVGSFGDAAIFSMELSKIISTGWGGILTVRDPELARRVSEDYALVREPSFRETARRVWQAALSSVLYEPVFSPVGKYFVAAAFRLGIFKPSTPSHEILGRPDKNFITRLSGSQAVLGAEQWRRLGVIALKSQRHAEILRKAIAHAGFCVLGNPQSGDISVTPRVSFVVSDRTQASNWFQANGIELGTWFDGPLSPLPESDDFAYRSDDYPHAKWVARHVVNLASHFRLKLGELERLEILLSEYARENPSEQAFARQFLIKLP